MTQGMVERVARALARCDGGKSTGPSRHKAGDEFGWEPGWGHLEKYADAHWREHINAASFAIAAMRAPSNDMLQAMHEAMFADAVTGSELPMLGAGFEAAIEIAAQDLPSR